MKRRPHLLLHAAAAAAVAAEANPGDHRHGEGGKLRRINAALVGGDLGELRVLARESRGFLDDGVRRRAWLALLHVDSAKLTSRSASGFLPSPTCFIHDHRDTGQVHVDVERAFVLFPMDMRPSYRALKQAELSNVINAVLCRNPDLSYYQGFHDICSVLVLVLGERCAMVAAERMALFFLRDSMAESLDVVMRQLRLLFPLIAAEDVELFRYFERVNILPFFSVSWVITWCSHNLRSLELVTRLFDFFLAADTPLMPVYFVAAVVLARRESIFALGADDVAELQPFLQRFPSPLGDIDTRRFAAMHDWQVLDALVEAAFDLSVKYPLSVLENLRPRGLPLSPFSCVNRFQVDWYRHGFGELPYPPDEGVNDKYWPLNAPLVNIRQVAANAVIQHRLERDQLDSAGSFNKPNRHLPSVDYRLTILTVSASAALYMAWLMQSDIVQNWINSYQRSS
eukprot:Partr_v1_DN27244_c0_g1_i2_m38349 putative TBC1 domain family member